MSLFLAKETHSLWAIHFHVAQQSTLIALWCLGALGTAVVGAQQMMAISAILVAIAPHMSLNGTFRAIRILRNRHVGVLANHRFAAYVSIALTQVGLSHVRSRPEGPGSQGARLATEGCGRGLVVSGERGGGAGGCWS